MRKVTILHLSDIHVKASAIGEIRQIIDKLIKDLNRIKSDENIEVDLICFAGDLISRGDKAFADENQIELAKKYVIRPLLEATGLSKKELILVPGNHEVNTQKIAKMTESGLSSISSKQEIDDTIFNMESEYNRRLEEFYDFMYKEYVTDAQKWNLGYSVNRVINGVNVGIVGLDSAWRSSGKGSIERNKMLVGEHQVGVLFENIKDADLKICLMHHPLDWLSDLEMSVIERKLNSFDIVLRGHVHALDDKQISTQRYRTIYNTSGKLYPLDDFYSGYSLLQFDMEVNKCTIYSREYYKLPRDEFDMALRVNENGKAEYFLMSYDEEKMLEADMKMQLKKYFSEATEKYAMLKNIDSYSPDKIQDFFVRPTIYTKSEYERKKERNKNLEDGNQVISLDKLLDSKDNILLIGKKEIGKTTLLQQFGITYASSESEKIPVYIDMLNITSGRDRVFLACRNFLFNIISDGISLSKQQVNHLLENGKLICLIDNIDLLNADHIKWIYDFIKEYPKNRFVFAAEEQFVRTYSMEELPDFGVEYKSVYLPYFKKKQVREMVNKWGEGKQGFDANIMTKKIVSYCNNINFAMTPFNVAIFLTIWDVDRNFIPINEGQVMQTYLEVVLDKFSTESFSRSAYGFDLKLHCLGYTAYQMYKKDEYFFAKEEFDQVIQEYHEEMGFKKSDSNFDKIFLEKNILCYSGNLIFFANTSVLEFCLAYYAQVDENLYRQMISKEYRGVFSHELSFYAGIVKDCSDLLEELSKEISETILDNLEILEMVENIKIDLGIDIDKDTYTKTMVENRKSIEEIDDMEERYVVYDEKTPLEITKLNTREKKESFLQRLTVYGNVIKNAETISKNKKQFHLQNYIRGINFQFAIWVEQFSEILSSKTKEDLPEDIKSKYPNITKEEFDKMKKEIMDLIKIIFPVGLQFYVSENIGTPKLEVAIKELISYNYEKCFTKFMLIFLLCDIGNGDIKNLLLNYIKEEDSKAILTLILGKLSMYYELRYFGNDIRIDNVLMDLITEVSVKLDDRIRGKRSQVRGYLKKRYDSHRIE